MRNGFELFRILLFRQIPIYRSVSLVNVGATISRPRREMLRIRLYFQRNRNIVPPGD